jgi:hypothetical protein
MRFLPILIAALIIAVIVPNVCAENVTYPQGYYELNKQADDLWAQQSPYGYSDAIKSIMLKISANQIALEKQNELINEQNELLRKLLNQTYMTSFNNVSNGWPTYQIQPNL